jgi:hypothetical protein
MASQCDNWAEISKEIEEKELLFASRQGTSDEKCAMSGCNEKRLSNVAYCVNHFYDMGWRK